MSSSESILASFRNLQEPTVYEGGFTAFIFLDTRRPQKSPSIEIKLGPFPTRAEARNAAVKACARVKGKGFWIQNPRRTRKNKF